VTTAAQRRSLEEAIVDTVREPLVVLDDALRVVVASRSFYRAFAATRQDIEGRFFMSWETASGTFRRSGSF
jgi:PAS domain-containing protein